MKIFNLLESQCCIEKKLFPFIEQMEDRDIIIVIGRHQSLCESFNAKQLHAHKVGSQATIERRLKRLKDIGWIIRERRSDVDKRNVFLTLTPKAMRSFKKYEEWMRENAI